MKHYLKTLFTLLLITAAASLFAEPPVTVYISPNNDGIKDELSFPLHISDKRYIQEWAFVITDENGIPVRIISNKEKRPDKPGFSAFWKMLTKPKAGVLVPDSLRWDGTLDSGEIAQDGIYYYYVTAADDNNNVSKTASYRIVVDKTPPELSLKKFEHDDDLIFSPDGDGNKDTITFTQSGSSEDLWRAVFTDAAGNTVKTFMWINTSPKTIIWDGKTDIGSVAPDGIYVYTISATDRGGNSVSGTIENIILNTEKPSINISIDTAAFSPNGDKVKDTVKLIPSIPIKTGLLEWELSVIDKEGTSRRSYSGVNSVPADIDFDGKDGTGILLPQGDYQATLNASYINGYAPVSLSPFFTLDITAPSAYVRSSMDIFSPNGDGVLDTIQIFQEGSAENSWTGSVKDSAGNTIKVFTFGNIPHESVNWDGMTDKNALTPDGTYTYELTATDKAGNTGSSNTISFRLDTAGTDVILTANQTAFSPNGDNIQETIVFTPVVKTGGITRYTLTIADEQGKAIKTFSDTRAIPASISWNGIMDDGTRAPDGTYTASLEAESRNGTKAKSSAPSFIIDTVYPSVTIEAPYLVFSPNGDGIKDTLPIKLNTSDETLWTARILDSKKNTVREFTWAGKAKSFDWDATDEAGNMVSDGVYSFEISAADTAGNKNRAQLPGITVDSRVPKAYITASLGAFSPNADGVKDIQKLSIVTTVKDGIESWKVAIVSENGSAPVMEWSSSNTKDLPAVINWNGKTASGAIAEGRFTAVLTLNYAKGDSLTVSTPVFLSSVTPPELTVRMSPKYFSPDNDGIDDDLFISLKANAGTGIAQWSLDITAPNGTPFWKTGGNSAITERIIWDGRSNKGELVQAATDYPFTFTVTDDLGMTSLIQGVIPVDVLVIRVGDVLKIQVPSIIFRENAADFNGLDPAIVEKNNFVLKRVAEILNKFKDYKVTVEGHANNISGTEKEEVTELVPLSEARANAVRNILIKNGVDSSRLSAAGVGGRQPVAARSDRDNWWKNRRVEFILIK